MRFNTLFALLVLLFACLAAAQGKTQFTNSLIASIVKEVQKKKKEIVEGLLRLCTSSLYIRINKYPHWVFFKQI